MQRPVLAQLKYTFSQFGSETVDFVEQPVKWDGNDWLTLGLIGAGTFLVSQNNQPIRTAVLTDGILLQRSNSGRQNIWRSLYSYNIIRRVCSVFADNECIGTRKIAYGIGQASLLARGPVFCIKTCNRQIKALYG